MKRCQWANSSRLEMEYHDKEWGVPVHDDRLLFEFLILEGAQAGLSWSTILKKREGYRQAFDNFVAEAVAVYTNNKIDSLLSNPKIIRNKPDYSSTHSIMGVKILDLERNCENILNKFIHDAQVEELKRLRRINL